MTHASAQDCGDWRRVSPHAVRASLRNVARQRTLASADAFGVLKEVTMLIDNGQTEFTHCPPVGGFLRRR